MGEDHSATALREAAVDRKPMTLSRWIVGVAALGGSVPLIGIFATAHSADAAGLIMVVAMLLILGCAMLAPVLIPPLVWLLTAPLAAAPGAAGMLARHSAVTAVRRTASTVAPVLLTVGFAGAMLAALDTLTGTEESSAASRIIGPAMVTPHRSGCAWWRCSPTRSTWSSQSCYRRRCATHTLLCPWPARCTCACHPAPVSRP